MRSTVKAPSDNEVQTRGGVDENADPRAIVEHMFDARPS
jgi:hypothetical protein